MVCIGRIWCVVHRYQAHPSMFAVYVWTNFALCAPASTPSTALPQNTQGNTPRGMNFPSEFSRKQEEGTHNEKGGFGMISRSFHRRMHRSAFCTFPPLSRNQLGISSKGACLVLRVICSSFYCGKSAESPSVS